MTLVPRVKSAPHRLNEIDLFRFVAAVSVVFFHYAFRGHAADALSALPYPLIAQFAKYGFLGVDFFFMISGFVILMTAANGKLQAFFVSRVARLYPAFWASCTISFLAIWAIGFPTFQASISQYMLNMTMLGGFLGVAPIDGVYWSLFVEIRFYFLIATVLALKLIDKVEHLFAAWMTVAAILYFCPVPVVDDLLIASYASYFIGGGALYLVWSKGVSWYRAALILLAYMLSVIRACGVLPEMEVKYRESFDALIVALLITSFYLVMLAVAVGKTRFLGRRNWLWAGAITYPLYLLHQNIGYMVFNAAHHVVNSHLLFWSVFFGMLLFSYAVHMSLEKPLATRLRVSLTGLLNSFQGIAARGSRAG
jgi:peptidoglycan/LPS O-acetylase OafA/YrhL